MIFLHIPAEPVATPRPRAVRTGKNVRMYSGNRASRDMALLIRMTASEQYDGPPLLGPLRVDCTFLFPRPKSMVWKTKPMPRVPHVKKPDRDNLDKTVLDALTGLLWRDDAQVCAGEIEKWVVAGDERPGVVVCVREIEG